MNWLRVNPNLLVKGTFAVDNRPDVQQIVQHCERRRSDVRGSIRVHYHCQEYQVVLGPPYFVEQDNGALLGSGMPTINLADPHTGELRIGLTVEIPEAPLKPGQVLVAGKAEGLRALTEAGVVRFTGNYYRSEEFATTFAVCDLLIGSSIEPKLSLASLLPNRVQQEALGEQPEKDHSIER